MTPDDKLIEEDVSLMRRKALTFDLPPDIKSLATTNPEVPRQFAAWLKTARPEDLPPIEYGIVDPGDFAEFHRGIGRGKIVMSHLIRDAEPEARATALMHEVFHFWDMKIAKNPYQTESYGHTSAENRADREYDPYLVTAHFWQHIRPEKRISPLSSSLDRLPTEGDEVRRKVDALMRHKEKAGR
ncbi:MAG: hypothetical protein M0D55_14195 [Elusimicrobiota bacterium]|nr:MAG: hypothetical protein M0D55_14195 [Elusimicrobiota bacterium]